MLTVKDILNTARETYLNDAAASIFTDTKLLPLFKSAYGFLETELEKNGVKCKFAIHGPVIIKTGDTKMGLPADFMWPISMDERLSGSSDLFIPMVERRFIPSVNLTDKLIYWVWNLETEIGLLGATTDREVRLFYQRRFPAIQDVENVVYGKAEQYLSAKIAALAHIFQSQNTELAKACDMLAEENIDEIVSIFVKKKQSMPVRRKPYIPFR